MYKLVKPLLLFCETPMHVGSGSDLGIVDLPIQRERQTGFPKIEASGLKGCIRESFEQKFNSRNNEEILLVFGSEGDNGFKNKEQNYASALGFTDGRILFFPVKSMKGVYAWVTCRFVLERFIKELQIADLKDLPKIPNKNTLPVESNLIIEGRNNMLKVVLEEYTIDVNKSDECTMFAEWISQKVIPTGQEYNYIREKIKKDIVVLSDDDFNDFVSLSTEVITRTKIDNNTGTVSNGQLFTEEYLPSETIMYSMVLASPIFNECKGNIIKDNKKSEEEQVMQYFVDNLPEAIQIGGNSTLGKGVTRVNILK